MKMHIIGVSGTIKRAEMKAKKFLEKWMNNYEQLNENKTK
jgi:RNase P/RNase MRP subunit POP5